MLALVIADMLFSAHPRADEGDLARRLNSLVRRETCADVASDLGLGEAVRLGVGERQSGGRRKEAILGDIAEAVIAAIYLDGGLEPARAFIERNWRPRDGGAVRSAPRRQDDAAGMGAGPRSADIRPTSAGALRPRPRAGIRRRGLDRRRPHGEGRGKSKRDAEQAPRPTFSSAKGCGHNHDGRRARDGRRGNRRRSRPCYGGGADAGRFVALIGAPNAGKSTLLNQLVGAKVSIVSHKVQTTRAIMRGIAIEDQSQIVFVDTPGSSPRSAGSTGRWSTPPGAGR